MKLQLGKKEKINSLFQILFPLFLFLYPLRHVCFGVGWTDTGYNYGNFAFMEKMDPMWLFSTYLGNVLGNVFTQLPLGHTMLGLNLYTGLFVSVLAVIGYFFFVKEVKLSPILTFIGEFLGINLCWCPTSLLYNYLSFFLLGMGGILLYFALMKRKVSTFCFILAGVMLGSNVFVRFPNLANMALIVAVWAMGIIRKEKLVSVLKQTGLCVLGYIIGLVGCFGLISIKYGAGNYIQGIQRLLSMPSEAGDYTIVSMVLQQYFNYKQNIIWLMYLLGFMLLGMVVYQIMPKSWKWIKNIGYVGAVLCSFYFLWARNMFNVEYDTVMSIFHWAVILLTATLIAGVVVIFSKSFTEQEKLLSGLNIIIILITPLGSNNHLYLSLNNLFFVAPFTLWLLWRLFISIPMVWQVKKWEISSYPLKAMLVCILGMIIFQTTLFANVFVFQESSGTDNSVKYLNTKVENNEVLKGMWMQEEKAVVLSEISEYVNEQELIGKEIIVYGEIPAMPYFLEMPFAISSWPDLRSYNYSVLQNDLSKIQEEVSLNIRELPVVLMEKIPGTYVKDGRKGLEKLEMAEADISVIEADKKLMLLADMLKQYDYKMSFENDKFVLFLAGQEEK